MTPRPRRRRRAEDGSALLLALVFITAFSLFVAAVISFAEVGLRASNAYASRTKAAYAADGAVNAAVERFGGGEGCADYNAPAGPGGPVNGVPITVTCRAGTRATSPVNAMLSLGTVPGEHGIESTTDLRVLGDIVSNSTVRAGGTMIVQGDVSALGECTPAVRIQTDPPVPLHCANATPASPADPGEGRDPDYTKATETVPVRRSVPACPPPAPPNRVVQLEPGYYDDDALIGLNALTAAGACTDAVLWFKPGLYYFDFTFLRGAPSPGDGKWTLAEPSVFVIGGTPAGWEADGDPLPNNVPGACQVTGPGVQIVMGGQNSRLDVAAGKVELCAEPSTTDQRIALFGMRAGASTHVLSPTAVAGPTAFTATADAMAIGEQPPPPTVGPRAAVAVLNQATPSASITLTDFKPSIPAGALIDSAVLRVVHQDDAGVSEVTVSAAGETCPTPHILALTAGFGPPGTVDLKACGLTTPADYNTLEITYTAATVGVPSVSDRLDGVAVDISYRTPVTRKPTVATSALNFAAAANTFDIGDLDAAGAPVTASAALGGATTSASITLAGMADPPLPAGSTIDAAVLRVAHREQGDIAPTAPTVSVGTCTAKALSLFGAAIDEDRVDLKADCGVTSAAAVAALTVTYDVTLDPGGTTATGDLDGAWLELVYSPPLTTAGATTAASPGAGFATPTEAIALDATTSGAALSAGAPSASLTVAGFSPPLPGGPALDTAIVRVRHQDDGNAGPVALTATWTGGVGGSCYATFPPHAGSLVDDRLDLRACGFGDPALTGLSVTYTAVLSGAGGTATNHVDGIVLDLAYAPPAIRGPSSTSSVSGFANPGLACCIGDSGTSDAAVGATPATITLGDFGQVPIPAGSAIDSARLRVAHRDDGPIGPVGLTATFAGATLPCGSSALPLHAGAPGEDSIDLVPCGFTSASQLGSLTAIYSAAATADTTRSASNVVASTFANSANALAVDGVTANAALVAPASRSITLDGYDVTVPAGATLDSAVLRVVHRDDAPIGPVSLGVSWTGGAGGSCVVPLGARPGTLGDDVVSLEDCGLVDLADLTGLSVTYSATLNGSGPTATDFLDGIALVFAVDRLDGVALDIVFRPPAFRPLSGCLVTGPYDPANSATCALVRVAPPVGDTATRFVAKGTIYAPSVPLDMSMAGLNAQVLTRGLIARSIRVGLQAAPGFTRPTGGVPPEAVVFSAYPAANVHNDIQAQSLAGFGTANNALAIDGTFAEAAIDTTSPPYAPATMQFDDFTDAALDAGTALDAVWLRVAHRDDPLIASVSVTITFTGNTCTDPRDLPLRAEVTEERIDLAACGLRNKDQLADLNVLYTATADVGATAADSPVKDHLDGIVVDVRFGPMVRAAVTFDRGQATIRNWSVLR